MRKTFRKTARSAIPTGRYRKKRLRRDCVLFLVPVGVTVLLLAILTQNTDVLAAAFRDPASILAERSPGSRDAGALYNTKPLRLARVTPTERVLPVVRERPLPELTFTDPELSAFVPQFDPNPLFPTEPGLFAADDPLFAMAPPPVIVVGSDPVVPEAAVPEPSTWLTSILGIFAVAAAMRRRKPARVETALPVGG